MGGNDYEIYEHPRTVGHAIADANPLTTLKKLSELFGVDCRLLVAARLALRLCADPSLVLARTGETQTVHTGGA